MRIYLVLLFLIGFSPLFGQSNIVCYAGNSGRETFYDVMEISDGTFLVCGYADNLDWLPLGVPKTSLTYTGNIPNSLGSNRYGLILHLSQDLNTIYAAVHFDKGVVEDIRFMKTNSLPYRATGDLFISCNTADTESNDGGYIIAKLNGNFVNQVPTGLVWYQKVWAEGYAKAAHPWDVNSKGEIYYISGQSHAYDWSAVYCLAPNGVRKTVPNWRTHWLTNNNEWRGTPASSNPLGSIDSVKYSGIVLKSWGRCELRSWTQAEYDSYYPDGNGGTRKGKWPADVLFNAPCDPSTPTANGPGYTGYAPESCCPVWGGSSIVVDRHTNAMYMGMNFKSYATNFSSPDFEPAVIAFDSTGELMWWSRLYHEITPAGDTMVSLPDQYVDALAIDYKNNSLVVAARAHGNNVENLWEGNTVSNNPSALGFQNRFTGTNGNIHQSWLGKLKLNNGDLVASTYVGELAEGTGGLGTPHADPNLDGWPDPNTGWPNLNTTYIAKNSMKVNTDGDVCIIGTGRRTITTANAYQKMVKPAYGGKSCWNNFVRMYDSELHLPKYSSLIVGVWDTLTQAGGDNTEIFGLYKTSKGLICVGRQKADANATPLGNDLPVTGLLNWGNASPQNESAVLVYYQAANLFNPNDDIQLSGHAEPVAGLHKPRIYPIPTDQLLMFDFGTLAFVPGAWAYTLCDFQGRLVGEGKLTQPQINIKSLDKGGYVLKYWNSQFVWTEKIWKN